MSFNIDWDIDKDWEDFKKLTEQTANNLKTMSEIQKRNRFQFGRPDWYSKFLTVFKEAKNGWMSSHC